MPSISLPSPLASSTYTSPSGVRIITRWLSFIVKADSATTPRVRRWCQSPSPRRPLLEKSRATHAGRSALDSRNNRIVQGNAERTTAKTQHNNHLSDRPQDNMDTSGKLRWRDTEDFSAREEQWRLSPKTRSKQDSTGKARTTQRAQS